jgi:hypothetical protein
MLSIPIGIIGDPLYIRVTPHGGKCLTRQVAWSPGANGGVL